MGGKNNSPSESNVDSTRTVFLFVVSVVAVFTLAELDSYNTKWMDSVMYFRALPDWYYVMCFAGYCVVAVLAPLASLAVDNRRAKRTII